MRALLSLIAGALLPFAFAPFAIFPLAIISLAILFCLLSNNATPRKAIQTGLIFGLAYFGIGVSWVQVSIHQFGLPVLAFSVFLTFLFVLVVASIPAMMAYCAVRFFPEKSPSYQRFKLLIIYPALWVIFEWVRSWLFTGFPWLTMGYSQIDSPLSGIGPVFGVFGISLAVAVSAGALSLLWLQRRAAVLTAIVVIVPLWTGALFLKSIDWTSPTTDQVTFALAQGNVAQDKKWLPEQRQATLDLYAKLSEPYWGEVDVIIWPETALPAFAHELTDYIEALTERVISDKTDLLLGLPVADGQTNNYFNSVITLKHAPDEPLDIYHKRHLVPFGEYLPLEKLLDPVLTFLQIPMSRFSAGVDDQALVTTSNYNVGVSICYEDVFGEEVITGLPEADFLVNISNDAWFGDSFAPHQHLEMARMRALETGRYMIRSTNTGISAVIDQHGTIIKQAPHFEVTTLDGRIEIFSGATPYVRLGNMPLIIFCFLLTVSMAIRGSGGTSLRGS